MNPKSRIEYTVIAEGVVRNLPKGTHFQFERRGYYIVDKIELMNQPMIVHFVPDGKIVSQSKLGTEVDAAKLAGKGKGGANAPKKELVPAGEDGKLSKKQLAKMAKKEGKKAGSKEDGAKEGGNAE